MIVAEVALEGLAAGRLAPERAPAVGRVPERSSATSRSSSPRRRPPAAVEAVIRAHAGALLRGVALFDIYRGAPLGASEKSLAYRLRLGAGDRTLTEPEVEAAVGAVVAALPRVGGRIRT